MGCKYPRVWGHTYFSVLDLEADSYAHCDLMLGPPSSLFWATGMDTALPLSSQPLGCPLAPG